jgi:hypothetical protein
MVESIIHTARRMPPIKVVTASHVKVPLDGQSFIAPPVSVQFGLCLVRLPPAALDKHVAIVPVLPTRCNPHGTFAGRKLPASRLPDVGAAIPAMISGNPYVARPWPNRPVLHDRSRGRDSHDDLGGLRCADAKAQSQHAH